MIPVTSPPTRRPRARPALATWLSCLSCLSCALVTGACDSGASDPAPPIDADTYVEVMAELADLRRFPPQGRSADDRTGRADSMRSVILQRHGVTAEDLLAFAEIVGPDPDRMLEITERIVALTDSLASARTGGGRVAGSDSLDARRDVGTELDTGVADADSAVGAADSAGALSPERFELPRTIEHRERLRRLRERGARLDTGGAARDTSDAASP